MLHEWHDASETLQIGAGGVRAQGCVNVCACVRDQRKKGSEMGDCTDSLSHTNKITHCISFSFSLTNTLKVRISVHHAQENISFKERRSLCEAHMRATYLGVRNDSISCLAPSGVRQTKAHPSNTDPSHCTQRAPSQSSAGSQEKAPLHHP